MAGHTAPPHPVSLHTCPDPSSPPFFLHVALQPPWVNPSYPRPRLHVGETPFPHLPTQQRVSSHTYFRQKVVGTGEGPQPVTSEDEACIQVTASICSCSGSSPSLGAASLWKSVITGPHIG